MVADLGNCFINGVAVASVINDDDWLRNDFVKQLQQRGSAIINARGSSSAASAANAVVETIAACEGRYGSKPFSLCVMSNGEYGVDSGLVFSFPCHYYNGNVEIITDISLDSYTQEGLTLTLEELRQEKLSALA